MSRKRMFDIGYVIALIGIALFLVGISSWIYWTVWGLGILMCLVFVIPALWARAQAQAEFVILWYTRRTR